MNHSFLLESQDPLGKEERLLGLRGTQLPKEKVRMLETPVTSGDDALAVCHRGVRAVGVRPSFKVESSRVAVHTCTCDDAHPNLSYIH